MEAYFLFQPLECADRDAAGRARPINKLCKLKFVQSLGGKKVLAVRACRFSHGAAAERLAASDPLGLRDPATVRSCPASGSCPFTDVSPHFCLYLTLISVVERADSQTVGGGGGLQERGQR